MAVVMISLAFFLLLLASHHPRTSAFYLNNTKDIEEDYIPEADAPVVRSTSRSWFLARVVKRGMHCKPNASNICDGVWVKNRTRLLRCCNKHCRDILGDVNNCGSCGRKCRFGERCCHGTCTGVANNVNHCGKCNKKCLPGIQCEFGSCGYA